ncbi:MAG: IclR family transcriptional regulator [Anaerolineaceae bacterium]
MTEIQSLARGLRILDILGESPNGVSVTELAEQLELDKGSASRLLSTLANYAYAEKDPVSRRYSLGPQVVTLSRSLLAKLPLRDVAKPFLRELMEKSGECSHVAILSQGRVLYIDQVESAASLRVNAEVGSLSPLHCTALGKAMLAFGRTPLPQKLERFTDNTLTSADALKKNLELVREQGFAMDNEEFDLGVRCIAAPVFDYRDKVIGSIGISGPVTRMTAKAMPHFAELVIKVSQALSEKMRFTAHRT